MSDSHARLCAEQEPYDRRVEAVPYGKVRVPKKSKSLDRTKGRQTG